MFILIGITEEDDEEEEDKDEKVEGKISVA